MLAYVEKQGAEMSFLSVEPLGRLLARLSVLRHNDSTNLFGNDLDEEDECNIEIDRSVERVSGARASPPPSRNSVNEWLVDVLGGGGVLTAWPQTVPGLQARTGSDRIMALSTDAASGSGDWWIGWLERTPCSFRDSYALDDLAVYRARGTPQGLGDWLPAGATYGIEVGSIEQFLHFGITVLVRALGCVGREPSTDTQIKHGAAECKLALTAAASGVGPAVLASLIMREEMTESSVVPADAKATHTMSPTGDVSAIVIVQQLHTFTLHDMLTGYSDMTAAENANLARDQLTGAMCAIASKVESAALAGMLKLNMATHTIIFCPELVEVEGEEDWELRGYGFTTAKFNPIHGQPFLMDFAPSTTKMISGHTVLSAALMLLLLLATVRLQFGDAIHDLLSAAVRGHVEAAEQLSTQQVDDFLSTLRSQTLSMCVERDAPSSSVLNSIESDFAARLRDGVGSFEQYARWVLDTDETPYDLLHTRAECEAQCKRLEEVARARARRRRESQR